MKRDINLCRLLVGLPDVQSRAQILRVILKYKDLDGVACMADGYSGSDLKVKSVVIPFILCYDLPK